MATEDKAGKVDTFLQKIASRKLIVWLTSTGLLIGGQVNGEQWVGLALAYIGVQGLADIATRWKTGKTSNDNK